MYSSPMEQFRARIILLGASNVTKGLSTIIETAELLLGSPLDVCCAVGHGRSYGLRSFLLVRSLPSVLEARLWDALARRPPLPTFALIADVGNDVMYGPAPEQIAGWVGECIDRLRAHAASVVMTGLPLERIESLSERHYRIARAIFFPTRRLTFAEARGRAAALVAHLERLAGERGVPLVPLPATWYGIDPIHIRRARRPNAWSAILRHWTDASLDAAPRARGSLRRTLRLRMGSPETWWLFNRIERGRAQPCAILPTGTRVSLY
jgi:hypothetical protein